jgi:hypothetical protein
MRVAEILAALSVVGMPTGEEKPLTEASNIIGARRARRRKSI